MLNEILTQMAMESIALAPWAIGFIIAIALAWQQLQQLHEDNQQLLSYLAGLIEILIQRDASHD